MRMCGQVLVATHARDSFRVGPDCFGEEHLMAKFRTFLVARGWAQPDAARLVCSLARANYSLRVPPLALAQGWSLSDRQGPEGPGGTPLADAESSEAEATATAAALEAANPEPELAAVLEAQSAKLLEPPPQRAAPWGYVVSVTRNGRHKKLHHVGSCRLVPGVDYKEFEPWGAVMPPLEKLDSKCSRCFGTTSLEEAPANEESAAESMDSSSSSSRASEPALKKRKKKKAAASSSPV